MLGWEGLFSLTDGFTSLTFIFPSSPLPRQLSPSPKYIGVNENHAGCLGPGQQTPLEASPRSPVQGTALPSPCGNREAKPKPTQGPGQVGHATPALPSKGRKDRAGIPSGPPVARVRQAQPGSQGHCSGGRTRARGTNLSQVPLLWNLSCFQDGVVSKTPAWR